LQDSENEPTPPPAKKAKPQKVVAASPKKPTSKKTEMEQFCAELEAATAEIVKHVEIESTTMKEILNKVAEKYTETKGNILEVAEYKEAIKNKVKQVRSFSQSSFTSNSVIFCS
jgi:hypothetical protein